jgi:hypothetical protein
MLLERRRRQCFGQVSGDPHVQRVELTREGFDRRAFARELMGAPEIAAFLAWLATTRRVSASTQNQARSALLFLDRHVLRIEIAKTDQVPRAKLPHRVPVVLSAGKKSTRSSGTSRERCGSLWPCSMGAYVGR